ncbi:MAG: TIGR03936 family radical SAM-associated protein [Pirellulaceae bacterium]|nr:TIGR03936 family radical SAM-associated protein [Pirellulaceae bacterium]
MSRQKLRIRFRKQGDLRLISHRDLARALERLFRRAELPLAMSEGFHPHPKITFPAALGLGIEGCNEVIELTLAEARDPVEVRQRLTEESPPGLVIKNVTELETSNRKIQVDQVTYEITIPTERQEALSSAIDELLSKSSFSFQRKGRTEPIDLRRSIKDIQLVDERLQIQLWVSQETIARPREILQVLRVDDLEDRGRWITRTEVHLTS